MFTTIFSSGVRGSEKIEMSISHPLSHHTVDPIKYKIVFILAS